tara:strand:- start:80 stop:367 length:288 start_codon:yes stop_codon:yes gene_type:complete
MMFENLTFMTRDWDQAIAGVAMNGDGQHIVIYDMEELVAIFSDRGFSPATVRDHISTIFAEARAFPTAPLLFKRATPAEARALIIKEQGSVGHKD